MPESKSQDSARPDNTWILLLKALSINNARISKYLLNTFQGYMGDTLKKKETAPILEEINVPSDGLGPSSALPSSLFSPVCLPLHSPSLFSCHPCFLALPCSLRSFSSLNVFVFPL